MTDYRIKVNVLKAIDLIAYGNDLNIKRELDTESQNAIWNATTDLLNTKIQNNELCFLGKLNLLDNENYGFNCRDLNYTEKEKYNHKYDNPKEFKDHNELELMFAEIGNDVEPYIKINSFETLFDLELGTSLIYINVNFYLDDIKKLAKRPIYKEFLLEQEDNKDNQIEIVNLKNRITDLEQENADLKENAGTELLLRGRENSKICQLIALKELLTNPFFRNNNELTDNFLSKVKELFTKIVKENPKDFRNANISDKTLRNAIKPLKDMILKYKINEIELPKE